MVVPPRQCGCLGLILGSLLWGYTRLFDAKWTRSTAALTILFTPHICLMVGCAYQVEVTSIVAHRRFILFGLLLWGCIWVWLRLACLTSALSTLPNRVVGWDFSLVLHMILVARLIAWPLGLIFIIALISRLLLGRVGSLARSWPHTFRIGFISVGIPWAWRFSPLLGLLSRHLKLLLAPCCLVLFIHEVYIVFLLMVEGSLYLLLASWATWIVCIGSLTWGIFVLELSWTASLATDHPFKVLEGNHNNCYVVQWLAHQTVFQNALHTQPWELMDAYVLWVLLTFLNLVLASLLSWIAR